MGPGGVARLACVLLLAAAAAGHAGVQPLSRIAIHRARVALDASAAVRASPALLGTQVCASVLLDPDAFCVCCPGVLGLYMCLLACSARRLPSMDSSHLHLNRKENRPFRLLEEESYGNHLTNIPSSWPHLYIQEEKTFSNCHIYSRSLASGRIS